MSRDDQDREEPGPLTSYEIDSDTVRVNNPDPDEPDKIIRRLADGTTKSYDARKRTD